MIGINAVLGKFRAVSSGVAPWDLSDPTKGIPIAIAGVIVDGGTFDWTTGHYVSNVIVFATLRS